MNGKWLMHYNGLRTLIDRVLKWNSTFENERVAIISGSLGMAVSSIKQGAKQNEISIKILN